MAELGPRAKRHYGRIPLLNENLSFIFPEEFPDKNGLLQKVQDWRTKVFSFQFSSVQSFSRVQLFATPSTAALQASLSITNSWSLPKLMSIELVMLSGHLTLCRPLLLLPSIFPSSGSFQMSQFFTSGGQSNGVSASASVFQ